MTAPCGTIRTWAAKAICQFSILNVGFRLDKLGEAMRRYLYIISCAILCSILSVTLVAAQGSPSTKHTASLSEFGAKVEALEQIVDDIALSGALALLGKEFPDWTFERTSSFDGAELGVSNDLGAISAKHEYGLTKMRGTIFRNKAVSGEQRDQALEILSSVKEFVQLGYEIESLVEDSSFGRAGDIYRNDFLNRFDELKKRIRPLSAEIAQAVKFSAL